MFDEFRVVVRVNGNSFFMYKTASWSHLYKPKGSPSSGDERLLVSQYCGWERVGRIFFPAKQFARHDKIVESGTKAIRFEGLESSKESFFKEGKRIQRNLLHER